jgi:hypothetical protein
MRCALGFILVLSCAPSGAGGVKGGGWAESVSLPEGGNEAPSTGQLSKKVTFLAGQRACVIAVGADSPEANLVLIVEDETGNVVARDEGAFNLIACWYPNRDMTVTVRLENPDDHPHVMMVCVK